MSRHRKPRQRPRRLRRLRPLVVTPLVAAVATALIATTNALDSAPATASVRSVAAGGHAPVAPTATVASAAARPSPTAAPTAGPAAPPPSASAPAAPTTEAAAVLGRTATAPDDDGSAKVGVLFSGDTPAGNHFCSASVLTSATHNLLVTAAHCVGSADGLQFAPGYRDGHTPYGTWQVTRVYTASGWASDQDQDEDFAILQVASNSGHDIQDIVGGNALGLDDDFSDQVRLYGYPAGGEEPLLCTNSTTKQDTYQRRIDCPAYPGGTSGGPWISTRTGEVVGVIGGYQQGGDTPDTSYSSYFDHTMTALYRQAVTGSS
ncbi:trypsin-like serine peptidase [Kitasatospora sp. NPDC059571]|uniref:trypsin-like serine peptidase n=1 Tax=Kitasatospora sp. NPDC059571 TaxID=3346871 RepID=UPI00368D4DD4